MSGDTLRYDLPPSLAFLPEFLGQLVLDPSCSTDAVVPEGSVELDSGGTETGIRQGVGTTGDTSTGY